MCFHSHELACVQKIIGKNAQTHSGHLCVGPACIYCFFLFFSFHFFRYMNGNPVLLYAYVHICFHIHNEINALCIANNVCISVECIFWLYLYAKCEFVMNAFKQCVSEQRKKKTTKMSRWISFAPFIEKWLVFSISAEAFPE